MLPAYPFGTEKHLAVTKGTLTVEIDGASHTLDSGDTMFFQANVDHTSRNAIGSTCGYFWWCRGRGEGGAPQPASASAA